MKDLSIFKIIETLSLVHWLLVVILIPVLYLLFKCIVNAVWLAKKEKRLLQNRKKPILLVKPTDKDFNDSPDDYRNIPTDMEREFELLKDSKFFNVYRPITADRVTTNIEGHGLIILGYCQGMDGFRDVLETAKHNQIPIIIYTFGYNQLSHEDLDELKKYPWHSMSNFPIRLINEVFTTLSFFKYKNEVKNRRK